MASPSTLRLRRSAAQLHALAEVEWTIRASDPISRRKYLREYTEAYQSYHSVIAMAELREQLALSDVVLVGDYHALPNSQLFCEQVISKLAAAGRQVVLGLEPVFARDQHLLDEWSSREIGGAELRERLHYDLNWGYDWFPFYRLLETARANCRRIYGIDCCPRNDLKKIARRDQHAAERILQMRNEYPGAVIVVLFGESHLAPTHLPQELRSLLPNLKVSTVLQNVDALYWKAAGEQGDAVEAVRVRDDVYCVFNATPLEKYESYRMYLERWTREPRSLLDLTPTVLNLIDALLQFLGIDKYAPAPGKDEMALVDLYPEVLHRSSEAAILKLLLRKSGGFGLRSMLEQIGRTGSCYDPRLNAFFVRTFEMLPATEEIAGFVHRAYRGLAGKAGLELVARPDRDVFYECAMEHALRYFGSRVLYPSRPLMREQDLYALYTSSDTSGFDRSEFEQHVDFLVMHRDYELHREQYQRMPLRVEQGLRSSGKALDFLTRQLGQMLAGDLYEGYLAGRVSKRTLRGLYAADLRGSGRAEAVYFAAVHRSAKRAMV